MNMKRTRGRNNRGPGGGTGGGPVRHQTGNVPLNRNHVFDSIGPDLRVRGTSQQLFEKYLQLGRDATSGGDRVMAESYFQHADHYFRILNVMNQAAQAQVAPQGGHRRPYEGSPDASTGNEPQASDYRGQADAADDESDDEPAGMGDQPGPESRDIPIAATPTDA